MKPNEDRAEATQLMLAAAEGDEQAANLLLPLVYDQLHQAARGMLAQERPGHTLSATAVVHEAYLKLVGPRRMPWAGRGHFYSAAAQAMRRILIDHARSRAVRGGNRARLNDLGDLGALAAADPRSVLAVDEALTRLEAEDPQTGAVVRLRFFAGLSVDETAQALGVSPRTCARSWAYARARLYQDLSESEESER